MKIGPGRPFEPLQIELSELTREDLASLGPRPRRNVVKTLRDNHLRMARAFAQGLTVRDVATIFAYSASYTQMLHGSPAMQAEIARVRAEEGIGQGQHSRVEEMTAELLAIAHMGARQVREQLEDADASGEALPLRVLLTATEMAMDRTGFGKQSTVTQVNLSFEQRLERAIERSGPILEGEVLPPVKVRRIA